MSSSPNFDPDDDSIGLPRQKTAGITEYERSLLLQLIEDKKSVIEDKRTAFAVHVKKVAAWKEIETMFNSDGQTVKRTEAQLKKIWDNWKSTAKRKVSQFRKGVRRTGGGPGPAPLPPEVERLSSIIPEQLKTLPNPYDSDATLELGEGSHASVSVDEFLNKNRSTDNSNEPTEQATPASSNTNATNCHREADEVEAISHVFHSSKKNDKRSKDPRSMLVEYECEEHKIRMQNLSLQTQIFKTELSIKKRSLEMLEEEHAKKMKILDKQLAE